MKKTVIVPDADFSIEGASEFSDRGSSRKMSASFRDSHFLLCPPFSEIFPNRYMLVIAKTWLGIYKSKKR